MWYSAWNGNYRILTAQSSDGISWTKHGVAIDLGSPGEPDDYYVWEPSVVYDGDTFRMWYSGRQAGGPTSTFLAESQDGISWTKRGPVLDPGRADSPDAQGARDPTVRRWGSGLVMVYTGLSSDGGWRLCLAFSEDGVSWERQGIILDLGGSEESQHLANANLLRESDGSWDVYYNARGSVFQIFLATMTLDETGPTFEGAREVTDLGAGNVRIDWEAATDPSLPIRYEVFVDTDPTELGIEVPVAVSGDTSVEVEGLRVDHTYHVWVRATDALGNPDANTVVIDFRVTAPTWDVRAFSWLMPALIGAIVSVLVVVLLRRRRKDQEERHQGADRR
jgi:sucrose-6-phosphate hydrolase SacC (GH32 family)